LGVIGQRNLAYFYHIALYSEFDGCPFWYEHSVDIALACQDLGLINGDAVVHQSTFGLQILERGYGVDLVISGYRWRRE